MSPPDAERGQALLLLLAGACAVLVGALVLGAVARGVGGQGRNQRAADLSALAAARAMHDAYPRLFVPATVAGRRNPLHLERAEYLALARRRARGTAAANGARAATVAFPDGRSIAPVRVRVAVTDPVVVALDRPREVPVRAVAEAELVPPGRGPIPSAAEGSGYAGPLAYRQGKPMRPDVARAFDRMARAARADGVDLIVVSGYRSDAEQAALYALNPDPRWVAPPGRSLHRLGTELDLGPSSAYGWLARNAERFHFVQRYSWEPWHYGYTLNAGSASVGFGGAGAAGSAGGTGAGAGDPAGARSGGDGGGAIPDFVPARFAPMLARAAQRWNVSAALLAAQIYVESGFNPFAVSPAGARGIAQFMPGTARGVGLRDPFDPAASIDAQGRLLRDLLRRFGSVSLALAAYNAGPAPVAACGCVPPYRETQGYVARVLGLLSGAGEPGALTGLEVRLVR